MKNIFSSTVVLLVMLVAAQTASAIPTLTTKDDLSVLNAQATTSQYTGSRFHSIFRSIRFIVEGNTVADVNTEASLTGVSDSLRLDPIPVTTANSHDDFFVTDDDSYNEDRDRDRDRDRVAVPEPSLVALIALGLVGFGLLRRKNNH